MIFESVSWHNQLDSTSVYAKEMIASGAPVKHGDVFAARQQPEGRGRRGRRWISQPGKDLTFSFVLEEDDSLKLRQGFLPYVIGLGIIDFLSKFDISANLKWPNDILVYDKKICGILVERLEVGEKNWYVCGIGLNLGMEAVVSDLIDQPATSVLQEKGQTPQQQEALEKTLECQRNTLIWFCGVARETLIGKINSNLSGIGRKICVSDEKNVYEGQFQGIGELGQMLLVSGGGVIKSIFTGTVNGVKGKENV